MKIGKCRKCNYYNDAAPGIGNKKCMKKDLPIGAILIVFRDQEECYDYMKRK